MVRPLIPQNFSGFGIVLKTLHHYDLPYLLKWRNNEMILPTMHDGRPVTLPVLEFWFKKVETSGHTFPFLAYHDGEPVAYIDLRNCDFERHICEDGIFLFGSQRFDQGMGSRIWLCREHLLRALNIWDVVSTIRPENQRSIRFFEKMGGRKVGMKDGFLLYVQEYQHRMAALGRAAAAMGLSREYENAYGEAWI